MRSQNMRSSYEPPRLSQTPGHVAAFLSRVQHSRTLRRFEDVFNQGTIIPRRAIQVLSDHSAVPSPDETRGQIRPPLSIFPRSYPNNGRNNFRYTLTDSPPRMYNCECVREMQLRYPAFRIIFECSRIELIPDWFPRTDFKNDFYSNFSSIRDKIIFSYTEKNTKS